MLFVNPVNCTLLLMPRTNDPTRPILVKALSCTLQSLEQSEELEPDDPALREIMSSILRMMANREIDSRKDETDSQMDSAA